MIKPIPGVLYEYVSGLVGHDVYKVAETRSDDLLFISATHVHDNAQFLDMLRVPAGFQDWRYAYDAIEDRGKGNDAIEWRQGGTHTGAWSMLERPR